MSKVYLVFCRDDDCAYEGMTKEQILTAIQQAVNEGTISDIDAGFITKIKELNTGDTLQFWRGTEAQYNAVKDSLPENVIVYKTDDSTIDDITNKIDKISSTLQLNYDLVIRTQKEFEEWYTSLDEGTCTAHSVLLMGTGGGFEFTRSDSKGLLLPTTLTRIDGINNAIITLENLRSSYGLYYETVPTGSDYCISNITINCKTLVYNYVNCTNQAFGNCINLTNCNANTDGIYPCGFYGCLNLVNCTAVSNQDSSAAIGSAYGFHYCTNLVNCEAQATSSASRPIAGFYNCRKLTNCKGLADSTTAKSYGFSSCIQLSNCIGRGTGTTGYGYSSCTYSNGCKADSTASTTANWTGTNTKRDDDSCDTD